MTKLIRETTMDIPPDVDIHITGTQVRFKAKKGESSRTFYHPRIHMVLEGKTLTIKCPEKRISTNDKMMINTFRAHIRNMIKGVQEGYTARLKVCSGHFPITVTVDGSTILIKNFLGEKNPRKAHLYTNVKAKIEGDTILLEGADKEAVSQSAARIENATRITNRDRRIFQDGCYIIKKPGDA